MERRKRHRRHCPTRAKGATCFSHRKQQLVVTGVNDQDLREASTVTFSLSQSFCANRFRLRRRLLDVESSHCVVNPAFDLSWLVRIFASKYKRACGKALDLFQSTMIQHFSSTSQQLPPSLLNGRPHSYCTVSTGSLGGELPFLSYFVTGNVLLPAALLASSAPFSPN